MTDQLEAQPAVPVLEVDQELDLATVPALRREVEDALRGRPQTLAVDLSRCAFAGVDALEALAALTAEAQRQGTTLVLVGLRPILRRAIGLIGLDGQLHDGRLPVPRTADEVPP